MIREKKPWAVAAAAALLLACSLSFAAYSTSLSTVGGGLWRAAEDRATQVAARETDPVRGYKKRTEDAKNEYLDVKRIGDHLVSNIEGRVSWLELLKAINEAMPRDDPKQVPDKIYDRNEVHITNLECQQVDDLSKWFAAVKQYYAPLGGTVPAAAAAPGKPAAPGAAAGNPPPPGKPGVPPVGTALGDPEPSGAGWVIAIKGYHYHNHENLGSNQGAEFVRNTLIKKLLTGTIVVPSPDGKGEETVSLKDLGISYPVLINPKASYRVHIDNPVPKGTSAPGGGAVATDDRPADVKKIPLDRFDILIHFCWKPTLASQRHAEKAEKAEKAEH